MFLKAFWKVAGFEPADFMEVGMEAKRVAWLIASWESLGLGMWRGWLRLYAVITVVWVGWFGYEIYDAHRAGQHALDYLQMRDLDIRQHGVSPFDGIELAQNAGDALARERLAWKALPIEPIGLPILFFVVLWVRRGFVSASKA